MFKRKLIQRKTTGASVYLSVSILFFLILTTPSAAQDYPNKPINIVLGNAPGGAHGVLCQIFADNAKKYLPKSQPIMLLYKTGAGFGIAGDYVAKAPADGYTILSYPNDLSVKLAKDGSQMSFTKDDFIPIVSIGMTPLCLPVHKDSPYKTLEDVIAYAKKNPGKFTYGTSGIATLVHLGGEVLQNRCGIELKHVPFTGGTPAVTAVMGRHIDTYLGSPTGTVLGNLKDGQMRLLAVFGRERHDDFPEVPTCLEKGYDVVVTSWLSLVVRKETPPKVVDILREAFTKTAEDPEVKKLVAPVNYKPVRWSPEEIRKNMDRDYEMALETWKKLGLTQ